jgi:peptide/nickel transport system substrate-binding protein
MMTCAWSTARSVLIAVLLVLSGSGLAAAAPPRSHPSAGDDTLVYGAGDEPDTLNTLTTESPNSFVIGTVFDSLLLIDPHGRLQPNLATSVDHSPDGRTWTFHLRHGVRWADGQPFTSADVAYNYRALFSRGHNIASTLGWDQIDRYSTPDAFTFVCHIKQVFAPFLLDVGFIRLLPRHIYDRPGVDFNKTPFNRTPFGTGPYRVTEWQAGDHITLVANPYSWRGRPSFQKIIYKIVPDPNTLLVQLRTGAVDMGIVVQNHVAQARDIAGTHSVTWLDNWYERIDLKQWGFLREKAVRQALDYATPKEAIWRGILHGLGAIAYSDISPLLTDYYNPNVPKHPFNLARATSLLAADGFVKGTDGVLRKGGQPLAIELSADTGDANAQRINEVLQQEWGRLGIKVSLRVEGDSLFYGPSGPFFSKMMTAETNPVGPLADPDDSLFWNSKWIPPSASGPGQNWPAVFHPYAFQRRIDDLTNAGLATIDPVKRRAIYFKVQALLADEVPVIFLYWQPRAMLIPDDLRGFVANPFNSQSWNVTTWRRG